MLHASTRKLIDRLAEMTELGKLDWVEGADGAINYSTEGYSVSLTEAPNELIITSKDGKELERASAEELAATESEENTPYAVIVAAMTKEAARIARGTETAISTLLAGMQDAPAETEVTHSEESEMLEEDLGDDTAVAASEAIEVSEEVAEAAVVDEDISESEVQADTPDTVDTSDTEVAPLETHAEDASEAHEDPVDTIVADVEPETTESATAESGADAEEIDDTPSEEESALNLAAVDASEEDNASSVAEDNESTDEEPLDRPAIAESDTQDLANTEAEPLISSAAEQTDETLASETHPEIDDVEVEADAREELAAEGDPIPHADSSETATEVTEAVARLADEVNTREDTGLETAAATAVGAVALAAGLQTEDEAESTEETAEPETELEAAPVVETNPSPAYVPFGLSETEAEPELEASTEPDLTAPEPEVLTEMEENTSPTIALAQMVDDAMAPHVELETEATPSFEISPEPETTEIVEDAIIASSAPEHEVLDTSIDPVVPDTSTVDESVESTTIETITEAVAETPEPAPAAQSYSLSGIGAGFGLGALSAKTEASGVPGPRPDETPPSEKVVIDATDDVLPKLEGNLNLSLAKTASAAMSTASADAETTTEDAVKTEADTDILKPRTRFNPWD